MLPSGGLARISHPLVRYAGCPGQLPVVNKDATSPHIIKTMSTDRLLDNLYTAVLVFDKDLRLTDINNAGETLFFISRGKMYGHSAYEMLAASHKLLENIERTRTTKQSRMEWGIDLDLPDAKTVCVDCIVTPVIEGETCKEVILELINADSRVRALRENNLSYLHDAARKSLSGIAHEIKNPLGGLRGAAQLLERELNGSSLVEYTRIIINEADRLRNLVDRMLAPVSRNRTSSVNIHRVLEHTCGIVEAESEFNVIIRRDYDPSLPALRADREQLIQALLNICRNALQAIDETGEVLIRTRIKRRCTIRQKHYKLAVRIDIIDNGPGVPAEIEDHIFYPMVTGRVGGSGLGLSISQSLIQSQNGMIQYERINGRTHFRILLPVE